MSSLPAFQRFRSLNLKPSPANSMQRSRRISCKTGLRLYPQSGHLGSVKPTLLSGEAFQHGLLIG